MPTTLRVTELRCHPVKSLRAVALEAARITGPGIEYDRHWMVVDAAGTFMTQRAHPQMATVAAGVHDGELVLSQEGAGELHLPVEAAHAPARVRVWKDDVDAVDCGDEAAAWLAAALDEPGVRLVRMRDGFRRTLDPRFVPSREPYTGFADGYPFLVTSEASLADLNSRMAAPLPMERFRPNIVVAGDALAPWAEDTWRRLRIGDVEFDIVKPCARCAITTTDQHTGARSPDSEPLRTLATFRRGESGGVIFGQNAVHRGPGTIRVGDSVEIVESLEVVA